MAGDKRVIEYSAETLGLASIDAQAVATTTTNGNILRLNRPHAVALYWDIANTDDDATVGEISIEFDVYDEAGTTIIWSGDIVTVLSTVTDDKGCAVIGGGVTAATSNGTLNGDTSSLVIFNNIRFKVTIDTANDDGTACTVNVRALVQE